MINHTITLPTQGWQCPSCRAVMSPTYPTCFYCKPAQTITNSGCVQITTTPSQGYDPSMNQRGTVKS